MNALEWPLRTAQCCHRLILCGITRGIGRRIHVDILVCQCRRNISDCCHCWHYPSSRGCQTQCASRGLCGYCRGNRDYWHPPIIGGVVLVGHMVRPHRIIHPWNIQQLVYGDVQLHIFLALLNGIERTKCVLVGVS